MLENLPIELALAIFREAAELFVLSDTDHPSAVALAMTSRLVYITVRPTFLRRITLTDKNGDAIRALLFEADSAACIRDLTLAGYGKVEPNIFSNLTGIRCLRGPRGDVIGAIAGLPPSGLISLYKIQLWTTDQLPVIPLSVTHICLYSNEVDSNSLLAYKWLHNSSALTHIGWEFVSYPHNPLTLDLPPERLADNLDALFDFIGPKLCEVSIRLCGDCFTASAEWSQYVQALRRAKCANRIRLWRDHRNFDNLNEDLGASFDDALAGVDVWSEARPLEGIV